MPAITPMPDMDALRARLLRNQNAAGAATAITGRGPMVLNEQWRAAIDTTNTWVTAVGGTGTVALAFNAGRSIVRLNCPAVSDIARFLDNKHIVGLPSGWSPSPSTDIWQKFTFEWEALLGTLANIDNTQFLMGLANQNHFRDQNNVIGFVLDGGALNTLSDGAGTETLTAVASAPTLTVFNKYKIVVRNGAVDFYVNDVLKNTHTANISLSTGGYACGWGIKALAGTGATLLDLGACRAWYED